MRRIYVCGAYSADNVIDVLRNIGRGQRACAELFGLGYSPFCPWHDRTFITDRPDDTFTVEQFYRYSIDWLLVSDAVLVLPNSEHSKGTQEEIRAAIAHGIPVFYSLKELENWCLTN